jgi:CNH domain
MNDCNRFCVGRSTLTSHFQVIRTAKVTQIAVLEAFSILLVLSDKALFSYPLETLFVDESATRKPPIRVRSQRQKLSGSRDVGFFTVGRMQERTLVVYMIRDLIRPLSTFKVMRTPDPHFCQALIIQC